MYYRDSTQHTPVIPLYNIGPYELAYDQLLEPYQTAKLGTDRNYYLTERTPDGGTEVMNMKDDFTGAINVAANAANCSVEHVVVLVTSDNQLLCEDGTLVSIPSCGRLNMNQIPGVVLRFSTLLVASQARSLHQLDCLFGVELNNQYLILREPTSEAI